MHIIKDRQIAINKLLSIFMGRVAQTESPQFIGRVIEKLYSDPLRKLRSGKVFIATALSKEYNVEEEMSDISNALIFPICLLVYIFQTGKLTAKFIVVK
jgi:hypothetical protein